VVLGGNFEPNIDIVTQDCVTAISNSDGRELFIIDTSNLITTFVNKLCLVKVEKKGIIT